MNQHIEDYLAELVGNLGQDVEVFTGTSSDVRTPESHAVLVLADQVEGVVGSLYKATIKFSISSPADTSTRSAHIDLVDEVREAFTEPLPSAQSLGITVIEVRGFHITNHTAAVSDDGRWVTSIEALIGVTRL
jgi:hypothetical protein